LFLPEGDGASIGLPLLGLERGRREPSSDLSLPDLSK
jgi:hypothetical protein